MGALTIENRLIDRILDGNNLGNGATAKQQEYLDEYFGKIDIRAYWGTAREFAAELRQRWREFDNATK